MKEVVEKIKQERKWHKEEDERRRVLHDMLDKQLPGWYQKYLALLGFGAPLTKEDLKKLQEFIEQLRALPSNDSEGHQSVIMTK